MSRIRYWHTRDSIIAIQPDPSVLSRYLHGGDLANGRAVGNRNRSEGSSRRAKIKLKHPPLGGWKGGAE